MCTSGPQVQRQLNDMDLANWFATDSLSDNLRTVISRVVLTPEPEVSPITYSSDSKFCFETTLFLQKALQSLIGISIYFSHVLVLARSNQISFNKPESQ